MLAAIVLGLVPFVASACGESKAVAQPSYSPAVQPRLVDVGGFSLVGGRPTHVVVHLSDPQRLSIFVTADLSIASCRLLHVADANGSLVPVGRIALEGGSPHRNGGPKGQVVYWFGSSSLGAGYYRLDLAGRGHIAGLVVQRRW